MKWIQNTMSWSIKRRNKIKARNYLKVPLRIRLLNQVLIKPWLKEKACSSKKKKKCRCQSRKLKSQRWKKKVHYSKLKKIKIKMNLLQNKKYMLQLLRLRQRNSKMLVMLNKILEVTMMRRKITLTWLSSEAGKNGPPSSTVCLQMKKMNN